MATLGQQVKAQESLQPQRPTRSQRVQTQQERVKFEGLRQEAERVKEEKFKDKQVEYEETYYDYRPKQYSEKEWARLTDYSRQRILKSYTGKGFEWFAKRGDLVRVPRTRTATKTIPFTLDQGENSYENVYKDLSPELRQFFASPEQLKQERSQRIQTNIGGVDERISQTLAKISELSMRRQEEKRSLDDWWGGKSSSFRSKEDNLERYKERDRDIDYDYDRQISEQRGILGGLSKGRGELVSGKDIDFNEILSYAYDLGSYEHSRTRAKQQKKTAERMAVKDLEKRQQEAQAKGFSFSGVVTSSKIDPKTNKPVTSETQYFLGGAKATSQQFAKQFDVYEKPSGSKLIVARGTDFSKMSGQELETLFPGEFAQARTEEAKRLQAFSSQVNALPVTQQPAPDIPKKSIFKRFLSGTGDVLGGVFLTSTVGLGIKDYVSGKPTGLTGDELLLKREEALDQATVFGFTRGQLVRGQPAPEKKNLFSAYLSSIMPVDLSGTQLAGIKLNREVRESGEVAVAQRQFDVKNIESGTERLGSLNTRVDEINRQYGEGTLSPEIAQQKFAQVESERFEVFQDLASKGISTQIDIDGEGQQTLTFSSKALGMDLSPASVKMLRQVDGIGKAQLISGGLGTEFLKYGSIGLALGATGLSAKVGIGLTKTAVFLKPIVAGSPLFPLATKAGVYTVLGGAIVGNIGLSGYKGMLKGESAGLGKAGGFALGVGIPLTQTVAFAGGSYVGGHIYAEKTIVKAQQGGFTKPTQERIVIEGLKETKLPAQTRFGRTGFQGGIETKTQVSQYDKLQTKFPGTKMKLETGAKLDGRFAGQEGMSAGKSISKLTGTAYKGQTIYQRSFFFDKAGTGKTGIVTLTKTPKGVQVDQFRSTVNVKSYKVLQQDPSGAKKVFVDFTRTNEKLGQSIFVKGAKLTTASMNKVVNKNIDLNRLFTTFKGEDSVYSFGRYQQVISISPKQSVGMMFDAGGKAVLQQQETFRSVGSSRTARGDTLKALINQISKESGATTMKKGLLSDKTGGVTWGSYGQTEMDKLFKPESISPASTVFKIPTGFLTQDPVLTISPVVGQIAPAIKSAIGASTLLGTGALLGASSALQLRQSPNLSQRMFQMQLSNLTQLQFETPLQSSQQQQQQQQTLQQTIQQPVLNIPTVPSTTPRVPKNPPNITGLPDFDLEFMEGIRKRARKKKQRKDLAYVQDFTSKVVGFKAIEVSEKQAQRMAQRTQTGFELRAPIIVRKNNKDSKRLKKLLAQ